MGLELHIGNATTIPDGTVLDVVRQVAPPGLIGHLHVVVVDCDGRRGGGEAYGTWCDDHGQECRWIRVEVATGEEMARDDGLWRPAPYRQYAVGSRMEVLVAIAAHEAFHCWQAQDNHPRPYDEAAADAYAIRQLRRYRRGQLLPAQQVQSLGCSTEAEE